MTNNTSTGEQKAVKFAADVQTGNVFELKPERKRDISAATISIIYLIVMLVFFAWQTIDISSGRMLLLKRILGTYVIKMNTDLCRIIAFAIIGGGLGGIVNGFRSILIWHAERSAFGWRFLWKYITLPWLGATLAVMVYALTRAGIGLIGGSVTGGIPTVDAEFSSQAFWAFAIGAVSGYGSRNVLMWLDHNVDKWFSIGKIEKVKVPDLRGKTKEEATNILQALKLNLGKVCEEVTTDTGQVGKVVKQHPPAGEEVDKASSVDITIGKK